MQYLEKIRSLSDPELYQRCKEYGTNARLFLRKFAGLLPEVLKRKLYKRKGYGSIYEFAGKLAGMNHMNVDRILRLYERLKDKPHLLEQLVSGEVGWSKLEKVSYIATKETDKVWAEKTKTLSQTSLMVYVQEIRNAGKITECDNRLGGVLENTFQPEKWNTLPFKLSPGIEQKARLLKQKLQKEKGETIGWNEVLMELFRGYEPKPEKTKKITTTNICPECTQRKENEREQNREVTRYIPADSQKIIQSRSGGICEYPDCNKPGEIYHHVRRYALKKNHDPQYIRFLCKAHEGMLQMGLIENEEMEPQFWKVRYQAPWYDLKNLVDSRVAEFRKETASIR